MGERILVDEGYEVVTVSNADSALIRLEDVDPDVVLADTVMPGRTGFDICQYLKMSPRHRHVRVILTAGVLEPLDEEQTRRVEADGSLKKPFEASALLAAVKPLAEAAAAARGGAEASVPGPGGAATETRTQAPFVAVVDTEQVRAAVTVALDAAMSAMVNEITRQVVSTLTAKRSEPRAAEALAVPLPVPAVPMAAPLRPEEPVPAPPPPVVPRVDPVRRVSPVRVRSSSILGLNWTEPAQLPASSATPSETESSE
jgi:CheY-like chemotaxis protein